MTVALAWILVAASVGSDIQERENVAYVQASRAALREAPSSTSRVLGVVSTNAALEILGRSGEWCEVRSAPVPRAFIACHLIDSSRLTLQSITDKLAEIDAGPRHLDWHARSFWVSPSMSAFELFGDELTRWHSEDIVVRDEVLSIPVNTEFEAMKRHLASGVIVDRARIEWPRLDELYLSEPMKGRLSLAESQLPAVAPSHFVSPEDVLYAIPLSSFTLRDLDARFLDALSAWHRVPLRASVLNKTWMGKNGPMGAWDVAELGVKFAGAVRVHGVTRRGEFTGADVLSARATFAASCGEPGLEVFAKPASAGWRAAIVGWVGKPVVGKATVTERTIGEGGKYDRHVIQTIDLNADGLPDLAVVSGWARPEVTTETFWKVVWANVAGAWKLVAYGQEADCT